MKCSICIISDDFSAHLSKVPKRAILAPERLMNGPQMIKWVNDLRHHPKMFATCSLFIPRELYLQSIPVRYLIMGDDGNKLVDSLDDVHSIEVLDRDLE